MKGNYYRKEREREERINRRVNAAILIAIFAVSAFFAFSALTGCSVLEDIEAAIGEAVDCESADCTSGACDPDDGDFVDCETDACEPVACEPVAEE